MDAILEQIGTLISTNIYLGILLAFVAGVLTVFTPCSLSSIPLIVGYVGGGKNNKKMAFIYSSLICAGQTAVFVVLGVLAGTLGTFMGVAGFGTVWTILLAALLMFMGLEFLGVTSVLGNSDACGTKTTTTKKGVFGALIVGVLSALFSTPCSTPVLLAMLAYVSAGGLSWWIGGLMLLSYSLGHSLLLILAGTSVGFARQFSSSSKFAVLSKVFKVIFAIFMFGMALYFLLNAFYI